MSEQLSWRDTSEKFNAELQDILAVQLTAENIDVFAEHALESIIGLVNTATASYEAQPTLAYDTRRQLEEAAFHYYGLDTIENALDHVADVADEIRLLDDYIQTIGQTETTFLPATGTRLPVGDGESEPESNATVPRLKTLLFIAKNEYEIDIEDPSQFAIIKGSNDPDMMRRDSYYLVQMPTLGKSVLVNDAHGNATFVLDHETMADEAISHTDIIGLTKQDLTDLLAQEANLGKRIVYSPAYVTNLINALSNEEEDESTAESFLVPKVPEGYNHINGIASEYGVSVRSVYNAIEEAGEDFGPTQEYRFERGHVQTAYSPEQQGMIFSILERNRLLAIAPEGYLTTTGMTHLFGVSHKTLYAAMEKCGDSLGETLKYKFGGHISTGYSPEQQDLIYAVLERQGNIRAEVPEHSMTPAQLAEALGCSEGTVRSAARQNGDQFGEIKSYKTDKAPITYYSPEQIDMIIETIIQNGRFEARPAPEGIVSRRGVAEAIGADEGAVERATADLGSSLGETKRYRFGLVTTIGYTAEQVELIKSYLIESAYYKEERPEGYMSMTVLREHLGVTDRTIKRVIKEIGEETLGEVEIYKSGTRRVPHFSPDQIDMIRSRLDSLGYFNKMPEGYTSEYGISLELGTSNSTINSIVKSIGGTEEFGEVQRYKTNSRVTVGYSPKQQELIRLEFERRGAYVEEAPEGYISINGMKKQHNVWARLLQNAIETLEPQLEPARLYKFSQTVTRGFSPADQAVIRDYLEQHGHLADIAPEGFLSVSALARVLHMSDTSLSVLIDQNAEDVGTVESFKFRSRTTEGLSPRQQDIVTRIAREHQSKYEAAPEGVLSSKGIQLRYDLNWHVVLAAIENAKPFLGEIKQYRFNNNVTDGYDQRQQAIIDSFINKTP